MAALTLFIRHLAASLKLNKDDQFELAGIIMNDKYKFLFPTSDRESEFSGFDSVSE
jgi:hypothetical protein